MKNMLAGFGVIALSAASTLLLLDGKFWTMSEGSAPASSVAQVATRPVSFPQIVDDQVVGILRTQVSFVFDAATLGRLDRPVSPLLTEELMEHTAHSRYARYSKSEPFDLPGFKSMLKSAVEERFPGNAVEDVVVVKLEFLPTRDLDLLHDQLGDIH